MATLYHFTLAYVTASRYFARNRANRVRWPDMHSVVNIDFEWSRFPEYQFESRGGRPAPGRLRTAADPEEGFDEPSTFLRGSGAPLRIRTLEKFPDLYLRLKEYGPSSQSHLDFARKYGLLSDATIESSFNWKRKLDGLKELVELASNPDKWAKINGLFARYQLPNSFNLEFTQTVVGSVDFFIVPRNLFSAIYLQCVSRLATGVEVRGCKACGKPFQIGGDSGQRSNRRFCSDRCRFEFNHRNREGKS